MKILYNDPNLRIQKMSQKMALNHLPNKAIFEPVSKIYTSYLYKNVNNKADIFIYKRNKNNHIVLKYINEYAKHNNINIIAESFFLVTFCPNNKTNGIEIRDLVFRILLNTEAFPESLKTTLEIYGKNHGLYVVRLSLVMKVLSTFTVALSQPAIKVGYFLNTLRYFLKELLMKLQFR